MSKLFHNLKKLLYRTAPWVPHLVTASGLLFGLLSITAIFESQYRTALIWMAAAVVSDAVDGTLARKLNSANKLPDFDGKMLDQIVDYITYAMVPVLFIYQANLIPSTSNNWMLPAILIASAYQFAQANAKTPDNFFTGFPSYWNVAVFYILLLKSSPTANLILLMILTTLIFVPIKYYYPSRNTKHKFTIMSLTLIWGISGISLIITYPTIYSIPLWLSILCSTYYVALSIYNTLHSKPITLPTNSSMDNT